MHSLGTYYGLRTWSVTVGDPARREAYVGFANKKPAFTAEANMELPQPLWGMV